MRRFVAGLGVAAFAACSKAAPPPPPPPPAAPAIDEAGAKKGVADLWAKAVQADTAGDGSGMLALFTDDARLDMQGMPAIVGRAALETAMKGMMASRKNTAFVPSPGTTTVVSNDLVYQGGTYTETYVMGKKKPATEHGRYIAALSKGADGQWRFGYWMAIIDSTTMAR